MFTDFAYSIIISIIIFLQFVLWIYYIIWILFLDNIKRYLLTNDIDKIVIKDSLFLLTVQSILYVYFL